MLTDQYGQRALDFVDRVRTSDTCSEINKLVIDEMKWFGLDFVTSWSLPSVGGETVESIDINTRPESYAEHYQRDKLLARDPVVSAMRRTLTTLSWSDVHRDNKLSKAERFIIEEAKDYGATDGLTIPVLSRSGCVGVFSPCGYKPDLSPRARLALEMIGLYSQQALQRVETKRHREARKHVPLTAREREIIRWVAVGKTNDEIGSILGIQAATVKTLLARAQEKLDSTRRTYAVVQAIRLGELDLNF